MRDRIASRVKNIPPSGIRRFFDSVRWPPGRHIARCWRTGLRHPRHIREAGVWGIEKGYTYYTSNYGTEELRQEIARFTEERFGGIYDPKSEIIVTSGASEAADIALRAILDPGDEVLIPEPIYVCYVPMVQLIGAVPVPIPTCVEEKFAVRAEDIERAITPRTKAIVLNYPNNPTGGILTRAEVESIAEVCLRHDLTVVSDDIYALLTYEGEHASFAAMTQSVGVPLAARLQLRIDLDVGGAAGLMLHGVDVGDHAVVEPLVVGSGCRHTRDADGRHDQCRERISAVPRCHDR